VNLWSASLRRDAFTRESFFCARPTRFVPGAACVLAVAVLFVPLRLRAQDKPILTIDQDCQVFAVSNDNKIVCAVPHLKRIKKVVIQRADLWTATSKGKEKLILQGERFMPVPPPQSFVVDSLAWSPDGSRIAMNITTQKPSANDDRPSGGKAIALLDNDGREIKVEGAKTRFIESATKGAWLADNATVVYLTGIGPYKIASVRPADGQTRTLFQGAIFEAVAWDATRNQAFAVGRNLSISGREALVQLDLLHETVREIAQITGFKGELSVSPAGKKVGYFVDGDTIEVRDLADPSKPIRVRAGMGEFGWSRDERRVLLKRGPNDQSNDLVWVGLYDGTFVPALHDLEYHAFAVANDGESIVVTEPGRGVLKVYPLE
jgi:hypothetical protein